MNEDPRPQRDSGAEKEQEWADRLWDINRALGESSQQLTEEDRRRHVENANSIAEEIMAHTHAVAPSLKYDILQAYEFAKKLPGYEQYSALKRLAEND